VSTSETKIDDRRAAPRFPYDSVAQLVLCPPSRRRKRTNVTIKDYSTTGIGITHHQPLPLGQTYIVIAPYITRGGSTLYTVVRCDQKPDGSYSIGLHISHAFRDPMDEMMDELIPLPDPNKGWMKKIFASLFTPRP
jgi:hypothetical protein